VDRIKDIKFGFKPTAIVRKGSIAGRKINYEGDLLDSG
jgi:hypothetical protein